MATENKCWQKRNRLEKVLIVLVVLLICIVLIIFINALSTVHNRGVCTNPDCVRAATHILDFIDNNIDPCENFYNFVCGTFLKNAFTNNLNHSLQRLNDLKKYQLKEIVVTNVNDSHNVAKSLQMQRKFYRTCLNTSAIDEDDNRTFLKMLDRLGGWPLVKVYSWDSLEFDWLKIMLKAKEIGFPYNFFLRVVVLQHKNISQPIPIRVSPPYVTEKFEKEWQETNLEVMSEIASVLGAASVGATTELRRTMYFAEELHNIIEKAINNSSEYHNIIAIKDIDDPYLKIKWYDFLKNITGYKNLSMDDEVAFDVEDYLRDLNFLLMKTSKRVQANYICWYIISRYAVYLSTPIRKLYQNLTADEKHFDRNEVCYRKSIERFHSVAEAEYVRKFVSKEKRDDISVMFNSMKTELHDILESSKNVNETTKEFAIKTLDNVTALIGWSEHVYDLEKFDNFSGYSTLNLTSDNMMVMVTQVVKNEVENMFKHINKNITLIRSMHYYHPWLNLNAYYSRPENEIILPASILQDFIYNVNRPQYMNYGALGSIIGHEITHSILIDPNAEDYIIFDNVDGFEDFTDCVLDEYEAFLNSTACSTNKTACKISAFKNESQSALVENVADFTGLTLAYKAYQQWVRKNGIEKSLPGVKFTPNQIFWISSTTYICNKIKRNERDFHANSEFRANGPVRHNEYFAKDFHCKTNALMNPLKKCQIS